MNLTQEGFIKRAKESLKAAELLLKEELFDISVSRSYYTMFYIAEAYLLAEDLTFSKHSAVISAFGNKYAKTEKVPVKFHRYLIQAFGMRGAGDYKLESGIVYDDAFEQIKKAEEFLKFAEENL
jgi:uncharacterized protein (UPF0332 family)